MNPRLEKLLENNRKKKEQALHKIKKLGNTKRVWDNETLKKATIYIDV